MKEILKLTLSLTIIAALATGLLAKVNELTKEKISAAKALVEQQALKEVLPEFDNQVIKTKRTVENKNGKFEMFMAQKDGKIVGTAIKGTTGRGFSGNITGVIGFDPDGRILRISITEHKETPGLGTKVCDRNRKKTIFTVFSNEKDNSPIPNKFMDKFVGVYAKDAIKSEVGKTVKDSKGKEVSIDAISGATVSSKAVTYLVQLICNTYMGKDGVDGITSATKGGTK